MSYDKLIFDLSEPGKMGYRLPTLDVEGKDLSSYIPEEFLATEELDFPEVSEVDVIRHFTNLSMKNYGLDRGFYPLGSCTMKYNPKINEDVVSLEGFANLHPYQKDDDIQGTLEALYNVGDALSEISGMDFMTLQPAAGAHGEITGVMLMKAYHEFNGQNQRNKIIVPDSAHGTNPATAAMAGYEIIEIKSKPNGMVDIDALKAAVGEDTAGLMLTNPNTLGIYDENIKAITETVHNAGGLVYYDGANMNAILGQSRPGDMGFDIVHYNVHKTFSTPHGGGGPGAGPVGVKSFLKKFLPKPLVEKKEDGTFYLDYDLPNSLGKMKANVGHVGILLRTYSYILTMGSDGLKAASTMAVLNANYLAQSLKENYNLPLDRIYKHEFVLAGIKDDTHTITTADVSKRILDKGFHAPTVYFPLIVPEALMIEPTESEPKQTLDEFIAAMNEIADEAKTNPELLKSAPHNTLIGRPDETKAAKDLILKYEGEINA
ncbi:aminomethyl-transferring glycine dehydrogenase subunit GcvPB [Miniphocaeibacter massiliensis]|uniref:aminomethyl-transferring glycine dehydrogenase subunit GcvPB n=1 Tax=Miniphocaeibacter massiliensis TaxID=2041841 RepID=UPI000C071321|nr:aminomethyl-transferring glycine dehydrogenase subunit GcvPB [Miniphocaeibacter massiliensis]